VFWDFFKREEYTGKVAKSGGEIEPTRLVYLEQPLDLALTDDVSGEIIPLVEVQGEVRHHYSRWRLLRKGCRRVSLGHLRIP